MHARGRSSTDFPVVLVRHCMGENGKLREYELGKTNAMGLQLST